MHAPFEDLAVVAIFFWGRSGSVFLHSLFDSHPQVLTMPATRLNAFHGWQWTAIAREPNIVAMAERFVAQNLSLFDGREDRWFEGLDALGPERDTPLAVDSDAFVRELAALLSGPKPVTRRRFFLAAHVAYAIARGEDVSAKTTIVYHLHSPEAYAHVAAALEDFPELRALGVTREPIRSLRSYLRKNLAVARAWQHGDRSEYVQLVPSGGYNFVYRHQLIGWRELVARYPMPLWPLRIEDLNRDTEAQMRAVAAFLDLSWHECLTRSTFNGLDYGGDLFGVGKPDAGGQAAPISIASGKPSAPSSAESDGAVDAFDGYVLCGLLWKFCLEFGYSKVGLLQRVLVLLLVLVPTRLERLALAASLGLSGSPPGSMPRPSLLATLRQIFVRQRFSYRHLLCEAVPALRAQLPLPAPLSAGLTLPPTGAAPQRARASQTRVV